MAFYPAIATAGSVPVPIPVADGGTGVTTGALVLQAATSSGGYVLVNGTGNIITWAVPNDGKQHRVLILASLNVSSEETGGSITLAVQDPGGTNGTHTIYGGGSGAGSVTPTTNCGMIVEAGTTVTLAQGSALTVGAATLYAELWGL